MSDSRSERSSRFMVLYSQVRGSKKQRVWREGALSVGFHLTTLYDTNEEYRVAQFRGSGMTPNCVYKKMVEADNGLSWICGTELTISGYNIQIENVLELTLVEVNSSNLTSNINDTAQNTLNNHNCSRHKLLSHTTQESEKVTDTKYKSFAEVDCEYYNHLYNYWEEHQWEEQQNEYLKRQLQEHESDVVNQSAMKRQHNSEHNNKTESVKCNEHEVKKNNSKMTAYVSENSQYVCNIGDHDMNIKSKENIKALSELQQYTQEQNGATTNKLTINIHDHKELMLVKSNQHDNTNIQKLECQRKRSLLNLRDELQMKYAHCLENE